jgi:tight adherence protein B
MDGMTIPILIAAAVALLVFAIVQIAAALTDSEKRKLKQRLGNETRASDLSTANRSITYQEFNNGVLGNVKLFEQIGRRLRQAYPEASLTMFLLLCGASAVVTFMIGSLVLPSMVLSGAVAVFALYVPMIVVNNKRVRRQKMLGDQLPEALDFLSRILRAGHSLSTGLQMMSEELPKPLSIEFRRAYDQHTLGQNMDDCLKEMSTRIESTDFAFFVTAVLIQRQTGGDLSEVLGNISGMIRKRLQLQNHVKAKTAEGRFTGYILTAFPGVMFFISYALNPDYAGVLIKTNTGLMLLGIAFGMTMLGLYFIKKITTVRV